MNSFAIFTDSACDIPPEVLRKWNVHCISLNYKFEHSDQLRHRYDMPIHEFYDILNCGAKVKVSAPKTSTFMRAFETELSAGKDILYIGISASIGSVCAHARKAADVLREKYPERRIEILDSHCISSGCGLLVYYAASQSAGGAGINEIVQAILEKRRNIRNFFTVEDLRYLNSCGRINNDLSISGSIVGMKPVLSVEDSGKISTVSKVRGRKAAISTLADIYEKNAAHPYTGRVFISNAYCREDAEELALILKKRFKISPEIFPVGPVVGSNSGPGTLALFFFGK